MGKADRIIFMIENWGNFENIIEAINGIEKKKRRPRRVKVSFERHRDDYIYAYPWKCNHSTLLGCAENGNYIPVRG